MLGAAGFSRGCGRGAAVLETQGVGRRFACFRLDVGAEGLARLRFFRLRGGLTDIVATLPGALPATAGQRTDRLADGPAPARSPRLLGWPRGRVCEGSAESLGRHASRAWARRRASARAGPKEWGRCAFPPFSQPDVKGAWRQNRTGRHDKRVPEVARPPRPRRPRPAAPRRRARARATPRRAGTRPEAKTEQGLPRRRHGGQDQARAGHRAALHRVRRGQALAREI